MRHKKRVVISTKPDTHFVQVVTKNSNSREDVRWGKQKEIECHGHMQPMLTQIPRHAAACFAWLELSLHAVAGDY